MSRLLWPALLLLGCSDGTTGDTGTADDTGFCADAPLLTWDNFGAGFVTENCQSCHASEAADRYGAPEGVIFDTYEDTMDQAARVLERTLATESPMPPQGGVTDDDKLRLEYWLVCHEGV